MALMIHTVPRVSLAENTALGFEVAGNNYLLADVDGEVQAYFVLGPSAPSASRAAVAEGRLRCPRHGWPIDPIDGRCGSAELCQYRALPVEVDGDDIRISLTSP